MSRVTSHAPVVPLVLRHHVPPRLVQPHLEHLALVHVRVEQQLLLVVEVEAADGGEVGQDLVQAVGAGGGGVHHVDRVGVGEQHVHLGEAELGLAGGLPQLVALHTAALVARPRHGHAVLHILTLLVTEAPLLTLVTICGE